MSIKFSYIHNRFANIDANWFTVYRAEKSHVDTTSQNDNIHTMKGKNVD